jgi:hypothetical protein
MSGHQQDSSANTKRHKPWRWILGIALLSAAILGAVAAILVSHAEPILQERVIETLSARFHTKVQLDGFHVLWHEDSRFQAKASDSSESPTRTLTSREFSRSSAWPNLDFVRA